MSKSTVQKWLSHKKKMPQKWYDKGLRYSNQPMESYEVIDKNVVRRYIKV